MQALGFFAYPVVSTIVTDAILGAVELSKSEEVHLEPWQKKIDNQSLGSRSTI
jgi:hypothetical protein